jgi:hypothetical protein
MSSSALMARLQRCRLEGGERGQGGQAAQVCAADRVLRVLYGQLWEPGPMPIQPFGRHQYCTLLITERAAAMMARSQHPDAAAQLYLCLTTCPCSPV